MAHSAMSPVATAIAAVLQDATLQAATTGGWHEDVPQEPSYPFGLLELFGDTNVRGFGTSELSEIEFRTHVFSVYGGLVEAHEIDRQVRALLKDAAVSVSGYAQAGRVFYDDTVVLREELIRGQKVHEIVSRYRIYVEA